jgi:predicted Zn-dependent protease
MVVNEWTATFKNPGSQPIIVDDRDFVDVTKTGVRVQREVLSRVSAGLAEKQDADDPIIAAVEQALENYEWQKHKRPAGSFEDLPGIHREIEWIGERLKIGQVSRAEQALLRLIKRQGERSRPEDLAKTLTAIADLSRRSRHADWTLRILVAVDHLGSVDAVALSVRGETLRELGRHDEALAVLQEAMRLFPIDEVAPNAYAETLRDVGRHEEALAVLQQAMRRFPQNEVAPTAYAETLREIGHHDEALAAFRETMQCFPQSDVARNAYAETLRDVGRHDDALAVLQETMRRFLESEVAPNAYAETLRDMGRPDEALAVFQETMKRFPHDEVSPTAYAETLRELGRYDEALAILQETMRRFPQNDVSPNVYAETLRELGRHDEAMAMLQEAMRRFPQNEVARNIYAEILRDLGRYDEALAVFQETMQRFPQNEVAPNAYAETLRELGRHDEALAVLQETARRFPHNAVTKSAYAHLLTECGRLHEADEILLKSINRLQTHDDWINLHIYAMGRLRDGRVDEALAEFDRGASLCPFVNDRRYFKTARSLALISAKRADEAARQLEALAKEPRLPREDATNIVLFQIHALAEAGRPRIARGVLEGAHIVDFAAVKQKRLAATLDERYGLTTGIPATDNKAQELSKNIADLEYEVIRPRLWKSPSRKVA